jgi:hypothetical protein
MTKYVFANGQITVENGIYSPVQAREIDEYAGVVLIRNRLLTLPKDKRPSKTKRRKQNVE